MILSLTRLINSVVSSFRSSVAPPSDNDIPEAQIVVDASALQRDIGIVVDRRIRMKYKVGWVKKIRSAPITEIVLHGTAGGENVLNILQWMYNGERAWEYQKGVALFHYLIGRNGEIIEIIDPEYYVYHSTSGAHDKQTIGVELVNPDKMNAASYTQKQYDSLFKLIFDYLMILYPTINRITSHRYNIIVYNKGKISPKQCPGTGFSWSILDTELRNRGYDFKNDGQLRYDIRKKLS